MRAYAAGTAPGEAGIPDRLKREQMLALTHGLLASANILKTALYGWNPMAINLAQFQTLARRMLSLVKLAAERDRLVQQGLDDGWGRAACGGRTGVRPQADVITGSIATMDIDKPNESVKRWVSELRSLARRISSATPVSVAGHMTMLLALLFAVGLLGGLRIGESEIWLAPPLFHAGAGCVDARHSQQARYHFA